MLLLILHRNMNYTSIISCNATPSIIKEFFNDINSVMNIYELYDDFVMTNRSNGTVTYSMNINKVNKLKLNSFCKTCKENNWKVNKGRKGLRISYPYVKEEITVDCVNYEAGIVKLYKRLPLQHDDNYKEYISIYMVNMCIGTPRNKIKITDWSSLVGHAVDAVVTDTLYQCMDRCIYIN